VPAALLAGCGRTEPPDPIPAVAPMPARTAKPPYRFGVPPIGSARVLFSRYAPLVDCINVNAKGVELELESALSPAAYEAKFRKGGLDIVLVEPHLVLDAEQLGYRIFALSGRLDRIGGVIVVHRASQIRKLRDLRRRTICLPPANVLASTMMVRMWLHEAGFDLDRSARVIETTSEANALLTVCQGGAEAAGVSLEGWKVFMAENPEAAAELEAKWATDTLSGPALLAGTGVMLSDLQTLQSAFASLSATETGRTALASAGYSGFRSAGSASYDDVWEFVTEYRRVFRRTGVRAAR